MEKLVTAFAVILIMVGFTAISCTNRNMIGPSPDTDQEIVSSCVSCHTDKALLKEVASSEPVKEVSEATSGEG
ncbi:hypothetical protein ACFLUZ_00430 [Chloroflexota bacterium]